MLLAIKFDGVGALGKVKGQKLKVKSQKTKIKSRRLKVKCQKEYSETAVFAWPNAFTLGKF